ncbi:MAG: c-type cytochrome biogenesis protein CcmI [Xanthobacteraceae bacterium]|uniref:c-type cytochrome biogenesis protein CcmI n=1 Tax=Pseudolabrys sp. TaxID=1960880 RepID=UPI003D12726D
MVLWLFFALMTAAAIFAVLWPLSRSVRRSEGSDVEVYRDQLDEVARDRAAGLIGDAEAEAARIEVSRRLIAAAESAETAIPAGSPVWWRRGAAVVALIVLPVLASGVYLKLGSPQLPGEPLASRERSPHANQSLASLISQAEAHVERNPSDGRGWEVLAPVYLRMGRFDDAVKARRNALILNGETADRQADLGEAQVMAANGIVTAEARQAFERAIGLDAKQFKAHFFIGMAQEQDGRKDEAAKTWRALIAESPKDAPWIPSVRQALAALGASPAGNAPPQAEGSNATAAPGPSASDVAAASTMTDAERGDMIKGMVSRLADRLAQDGSDVEGWLRLMRAYMVLGESDKAATATAGARKALGADADKLRRINDLAAQLGIKG